MTMWSHDSPVYYIFSYTELNYVYYTVILTTPRIDNIYFSRISYQINVNIILCQSNKS